ncbi:hypothetical protein V8C34DRAFT_298945 [Trichoderma compactum]
MKLWLFYYRLLSTRARQLKRNLSIQDRREYVLYTNLLICDILFKVEPDNDFL